MSQSAMQQQGMQDVAASYGRQLRTWYQLWRAAAAGHFSGSLHDHECEFVLRTVQRWLHVPLAGLRVLDVGCGQRAPMACLFDAAGARVTGIDVEQPTGPLSTFALLRASYPYGLDRTAKSLARRVLGYDRRFYRHMAAIAGHAVHPRALDLRVMDVANLAFPDAEFDLVYSAVAFEHVADVPAAVKEVWRICKKPLALIVVRIHLFTCISGGHHQPHELATNGGGLEPWAHLRDRRVLPSIFLNGLRLADYLQHFEIYFDLREVIKDEEAGARALLTPEIRARLSDYSEDELLTQILTIIGTPKDLEASRRQHQAVLTTPESPFASDPHGAKQ